jgi:hypothetical protein
MSDIFNNFRVLELGSDGNCFFFCISYIFYGEDYRNHHLEFRNIIADNIMNYIEHMKRRNRLNNITINSFLTDSIIIRNGITKNKQNRNNEKLKTNLINKLIITKKLPDFIRTDANIGYNILYRRKIYNISCWANELLIYCLLENIYSAMKNYKIIFFKCPLSNNEYIQKILINDLIGNPLQISTILHIGDYHYQLLTYNNQQIFDITSLPQKIQTDIINFTNRPVLNPSQIVSYENQICQIRLKNEINNQQNLVNSIISQTPKDKLKQKLEELFGIKIDKKNEQLLKMNFFLMKEYIKDLIAKKENIEMKNIEMKNIEMKNIEMKNLSKKNTHNNTQNNKYKKEITNEIYKILNESKTFNDKINNIEKKFFIKININRIQNLYGVNLENQSNKDLADIFYPIIFEHLRAFRNTMASNISNDAKIEIIRNFISVFYGRNVSRNNIRGVLQDLTEYDMFSLLNIIAIIQEINQ